MAAKRSLTIVQMNDTHAYFDLHQELFWQGDHAVYREAGGYARIATIVKQIRAESQVSCLFCDYLKFIGAGCHDSSLGICLWAKGI